MNNQLEPGLRVEAIDVDRKGRILTKAQFGCLRDTYTINVTRGCEFGCVYCYARGYPEAPLPGQVYLYRNLPKKLVAELDNPRRRSRVPWVAFNTASDSFQADPAILEIAYRTMEVLLKRGVGVSFLTKGLIPDRFIRLFAIYPDIVNARIGLVSLSQRYCDLFEPHAAGPVERLQNIDRLQAAGIEPEIRIDPIIPFYTDEGGSIRQLFDGLAARGVRRVTVSYLHLRPAILEQLVRELPGTESGILRSCYETQPWSSVGSSTRSKLIPLPLRKKGYKRFQELATEYGLKTLICACKNPDMPGDLCSTGTPAGSAEGKAGDVKEQLSLFSC
jgi:DNA repair photolyase